jgi:ATP-dependent exoDNAse (exonuclease V) beta subunit
MTNIRIAGAGAGTGKTYYLTHQLADWIRNGMSPASLIATTFTRKAAAELRERVRQLLISAGMTTEAERIFEGYIGTVHSVCGRLLSEYALDAGLSPAIEVMPEGDDLRFFRIAVASIVEGYIDSLEAPAERLELNGSGRGHQRRRDWRDEILNVVNLARENAIAGEELRACGRRSAEELIRVLTEGRSSGTDGADHSAHGSFAERLEPAVRQALTHLHAIEEPKKDTQAAIGLLEKFQRARAGRNVFTWSDYAKLSKQKVNKDAQGLLDTVWEIAGDFVTSREFHRDLETVIYGVVDCAAEALDAYAEYKRAQGLMDYIDQETRVLKLAQENARFQAGVRESVERIFVDEFQDTSPIQLALFLALHEISGTSLWVGDPKQAIYGFRGTDPSLMDAAAKRLGTDTTLSESWRSKELLVRFSNAVFGPVLEARGYQAVQLSIPDTRRDEAAGGRLETWYLRSQNVGQDAWATAAGVAQMLGERTDLMPGDIAVLARKNDQCAQIAQALSTFGINASVGHGTLSNAAECRLAIAALRFLSDAEDTLALAEIVHTHPAHEAHGNWLAPLMETPEGTIDAWRADPVVARLEHARSSVQKRSPEEALEQAIALMNLPRLVSSWNDPERRRANLDALRGVCAEYLSACSARRTAATVPGFIQYYHKSESGQATGSGTDTVQVLTYHRAKGLEWRIVVLTNLDDSTKDTPKAAFGVSVESDGEIDLDNPLAGRTLRYWPWPFGMQSKLAGIEEAITASPQHRTAVEQSRDESLRLLYVGVTRAREELVLAVRWEQSGKLKTSWVDELTDREGKPAIQWPSAADADAADADAAGKTVTMQAGSAPFQTLLRVLEPDQSTEADRARSNQPKRYLQPLPESGTDHPPARITPSAVDADNWKEGAEPTTTVFAELGERIPYYDGVDETTLGTAVHAIFAAAYPGISDRRLHTVAERILGAYGISTADGHASERLVETHARLTQFMASAWPDATIHREWPLFLRLNNGQRMQGWIDLLLETNRGTVIIDHKSFPGQNAADRVQRYAPQLCLYRDALEAAGRGPVAATLIHLPFLGRIYAVHSKGHLTWMPGAAQ